MTAFLTIDNVSRLFGPNLSMGEKIAARLGADVETRSVYTYRDALMHRHENGEIIRLFTYQCIHL